MTGFSVIATLLPGSVEFWESLSAIVSSTVTAIAVLAGGGWAYWRFVRERTRWPRAEVELLLSDRRLAADTVLLNLKLRVKNAGRGLMELTEIRVDLHRVLPLDQETLAKIDAGEQFAVNDVETDWPLLDQHKRSWGPGRPEVEPGETDEFDFDFFLEPSVETVHLYAYIQNAAKKRGNRELGWTRTVLYDIGRNLSSGAQ